MFCPPAKQVGSYPFPMTQNGCPHSHFSKKEGADNAFSQFICIHLHFEMYRMGSTSCIEREIFQKTDDTLHITYWHSAGEITDAFALAGAVRG
jgi:hypothetical protein